MSAVESPPKGRGALTNTNSGYDEYMREAFDDGWGNAPEERPQTTTLTADSARSVITFNRSPDVPFDRSINPYRGCEHGCIYCFARPTHARLGLSAGLDFETRLFYKENAAALLRAELAKPSYRCAEIVLGANTDAYQPIERRLKLSRQILEVLSETRHPVSILTKSALIERDIDIIAPMAERGLARIFISVTTLDAKTARTMEPRAAAPQRRLKAIETLSRAGIPVGALIAPVVPMLTDHELERIMASVKEAGARDVNYVLLRLPLEIKDLFGQWLDAHTPLKSAHVFARIQDMREGKAYDSKYGTRMTGTGLFADLLAKRYQIAHRRLGFTGMPELTTALFQPPRDSTQLALF